MKQTFLKIGFIALCVGGIVFLLLPFLETPAPVTTSLNASQPQVVTSNPLNAIAQKIGALFGRKERGRKTLSARNNPSSFSNSAMNYEPSTLLAQYPASTAPNSATQGETSSTNISTSTPVSISAQALNIPLEEQHFDNAAFQTDAGEWVLVQQTAPQNSAPGMHEVNVHDNPYDRYLRQERARNFGPQTSTQEIPTSKWAQLFQPIKTFFGLEGPQAVGESEVHVYRDEEKAPLLASVNNKLSTPKAVQSSDYSQVRMQMPDISPQQWERFTPTERERLRKSESVRDFSDILLGDRAVREAAEALANAKFPHPKTPQDQQKKEEYTQHVAEEIQQRIKNRLMANIEANAAGKTPEDELSFMTGCADTSLPVMACEENHQPDSHLSDEILAQASAKNSEIFFRETKFALPQGTSITPVIGPTESLEFDNPFLDPDIAKKYRHLAQQQHCDSRPCFWLPNSNQSDPKLTDTIKTIGGATIYTDPFNTYDLNKDSYVKSEIQQAGPDITQEQREQIERQAREQWEKNRTNWVPCTEEQVVQLSKLPTNILVSDPAVAPSVSKLINSPNILYTQESLVGSPDSPIQQGERITRSLAKEVNANKQIYSEELQEPYQQTIGANLANFIKQIFGRSKK